MSKVNHTKMIEYIKIHRLSLSQDIEKIEGHEVILRFPQMGEDFAGGYPKEYLQGAIAVLDHLLEVANEFN